VPEDSRVLRARRLCAQLLIASTPGSSSPGRPGLDNMTSQPWSDATCPCTTSWRAYFRFVTLFLLKKARQSTRSGVTGDVASNHGWLVILSGPGRSGVDEPGVEAIGGCVHKRRALNTRLSSVTSAGTFAVSAGPYRNYQAKAGTKNVPDTLFVPIQKKGWKIDPHVSNQRSREFLFLGVQVHP